MNQPESTPNLESSEVTETKSGTDYAGLMDEARSEIGNERAATLEQLHELPIPESHKADILLVQDGLKPGTMDYVLPDSPEQQSIIDYLERNHISYTKSRYEYAEPNNDTLISIGHTPEDAAHIERAMHQDDDSNLGEALGYPPTAVAAFIEKKSLLTSEQQQQLDIDPSLKPFVGYRLSANNWETELATAEAWRDHIKSSDPELYEAVIQEQEVNERNEMSPAEIKRRDQLIEQAEKEQEEADALIAQAEAIEKAALKNDELKQQEAVQLRSQAEVLYQSSRRHWEQARAVLHG